jgi:phage terminase small subunit
MTGVKGKSGGARPGAGRKKKPTVPIAPEVAKTEDGKPFDPRPTLEMIALGLMEVSAQQYKALTALLPYAHQKLGESGKKEKKNEAAKGVASRFAPAAAPKLVAAGGKKV